ncbi:MAG: pyridoxal phosphate-dependent aminotransferase [Thermotogae bacterium]|nr:MAG: pyridoxal phosphate-dependent aminotransferase [Thermotogota bacterium]
MRVSTRITSVPPSPIRSLIPYADEAKRRGIHVFHLNIGQPDIETPAVFFDYVKRYQAKVLSYSPSNGLPELREKFCHYYNEFGIFLSPEEIIVTNGGSEAVLFALAAVADPGDEVLVIEPFYANYLGFAQTLGITLVPVTSTPETGYAMPNVEEFEKKITERTRAVLFSNPSNPTGSVYNREDLSALVEMAKRHSLYIISDEVYREFVFDGDEAVSIFSFDYDGAIMVDSVSKRYSACGARIGVFATKNKEILAQVMKLAQSRLSPPTLAQVGTIGLLDLGEKYRGRIRSEYRRRRDAACEEIAKIEGAVFHPPKGAFYVSVKLPVSNARRFVQWMLTDFQHGGATTMVAPLDGFYVTESAGRSEIRVAFVLNENNLRRACEILRIGVEAYRRRCGGC